MTVKFNAVLMNSGLKLWFRPSLKIHSWNTHTAKMMSYPGFCVSLFYEAKSPGWLPAEGKYKPAVNGRGEDLCEYCVRAEHCTL